MYVRAVRRVNAVTEKIRYARHQPQNIHVSRRIIRKIGLRIIEVLKAVSEYFVSPRCETAYIGFVSDNIVGKKNMQQQRSKQRPHNKEIVRFVAYTVHKNGSAFFDAYIDHVDQQKGNRCQNGSDQYLLGRKFGRRHIECHPPYESLL